MKSLARIFAFFLVSVTLAGCLAYPPKRPVEPPMGAEREAVGEIPLPASPGYAPYAPGRKMPTGPGVKVALLVPLSGPNAALGKAMQDAAVMAIFDKYEGVPQSKQIRVVELLPKDTGDTADQAAIAAREAVDEGAQIILGPVFGNQVAAVSPVARSQTVPVITFSNNMSALAPGVYLFGFIPDQQVRRVIEFALARGMNRIAGLAPSNPYGNTVMKQLLSQSADKGVVAQPIEYYPQDSTNVTKQTKRIVSTLRATPGNNALLIAEGGDRLAIINDALSIEKVTGMNLPLLGTGLWDTPEVLRYPALQGGIFASADLQKNRAFEERFMTRFGYRPDRRVSLAYDATALAATLALNPNGADFSHAALTDAVGFNGPANGIFRFRGNGVAERALAIIQITPAGFVTIEPSQGSFLR